MSKKEKFRRVQVHFDKPSRTVSSASYDTDLNRMVAGLVPFSQSRQSFYIDETILPAGYEQALNLVLDAQEAFMQLPPNIRERFDNDPAALAKALGDPRQQEILRELGLLPEDKPVPAAKQKSAAADAADVKPADSAGE